MGILETLRSISGRKQGKISSLSEKFGEIFIITSPKKANYLEESIKSEIPYSQNPSWQTKTIGESHPYDFSLFEGAYKQVAIIYGGINKTVDFTLGPGFYVKCDNKAVIKKSTQFMEDMNFEVFLRIVVRNLLIFGNAFTEIVGSGKSIEQIVPLDPKYMFVRRDKHGKIEGYTQYRGGTNAPILFNPDQIAHFSYNQIGDQIYGTSILRPLFGSNRIQLLTQFLEMEDAMKTIVKRRANAPIHVQIGSDTFPATASDVSNANNELVDLSQKNEIVTSHLVKLDTLNFRSRLMDIGPYIEHYENSIIYGLEVPAVLLGRANVPEGLANVQMDAFERRIKSLQEFIENTIEKKIFKRLFPNDKIEFEWGPATSDLESQEIQDYTNLLRLPLSDQTKEEIENILRTKIGLKELKNMTYSQGKIQGDKNGQGKFDGKGTDNKKQEGTTNK